MTWDEAEALHPGCSAQWDIACQAARGDWHVENLYINSRDGLTVMIYSTVEEFEATYHSKVRLYHHAYFAYAPESQSWHLWGDYYHVL